MAEEQVTITSEKPEEEVFRQLEDSLARLGQVSVTKKGKININPKSKYSGFAGTTQMEGTVRRRKNSDEYELTLTYSVAPTGAAWAVAIVGFLFLLIGPLILIIPYMVMPGKVKADVERAMRDIEDDFE